MLSLRHIIHTAKGPIAIHIDPHFLQTLLLLNVSLPELILLLQKVVIKHVIRLVDVHELIKCERFLDHASRTDLDTRRVLRHELLVIVVLVVREIELFAWGQLHIHLFLRLGVHILLKCDILEFLLLFLQPSKDISLHYDLL